MFDILFDYSIVPITFILFLIALCALTIKRIQGVFNSFVLMGTVIMGLINISLVLFGSPDAAITATLLCLGVFVLLCPIGLIINGIIMMKKESKSLANSLSLLLGLFISAGELTFIIYILYNLSNGSSHMINWGLIFLGVSAFFVSALILAFVMYMIYIQIIPHKNNYNYIIIHGCGLIDGKKVSGLLRNRINKAISIYHKCNVKPYIIASGGKGDDESVSEAEAIKNYLLENGIPESMIVVEDKSKTTMENLMFSKQIIDDGSIGKKTALVTNNYHVYRCVLLAKTIGFDCVGLGAKTAAYYWPSAVIREFVAVFSRKKYLCSGLCLYVVTVILPCMMGFVVYR